MKIFKRKDFINLPAETLFSFYCPASFDGLMIKTTSGGDDFNCDDIVGAIENISTSDFFDKCEVMESGVSVPMDFDNTGRDGFFDEDQLYAVYEKEDVKKLIDRLQRCL